MKKRMIALLLAGLLAASLSSCIVDSGDDDPTLTVDTAQTTLNNDPGNDPTGWVTTDQTIYTTDSVKLRESASTSAKSLETIPVATDLHCIEKNASWCKVEYKEQVGYVSAAYTTLEDLLGKNMVACQNPETWYVCVAALNVRSYATTSNIGGKSTVVSDKALKLNDTVTVVAKGPAWFKIQIDDAFYFVYSTNCLSNTKTIDPDDISNYNLEGFKSCEEKMYVNTTSLSARICPSFSSSVGTYLIKDDEVTVTSKGTLSGTDWCKLKVKTSRPGDPEVYSDYYVVAKFLSTSKGSSVTMSLEDLMKEYSFASASRELYVSADSLNVRSAPVISSDNVLSGLKNKEKVKVVAVGSYNEARWAIIEYQTGSYGFVSMAFLTPDQNGNFALLSLDDLPLYYPDFTKCASKSVSATGVVNCYFTPATKETPDKKLAANDTATLVATGSGSHESWCVVEINGAFYFAARSLFQ